MSSYVFVVYRHLIAAVVMAPFAIFLDRLVIGQNLYFLGTKYTTTTFAAAMYNILYYIQGRVIKDRGAIFVTAFSPLNMVIVAIVSSLLLGETLFLGRLLGALVIVIGLYLVVWGKEKHYEPPSNGSEENQIDQKEEEQKIDEATICEADLNDERLVAEMAAELREDLGDGEGCLSEIASTYKLNQSQIIYRITLSSIEKCSRLHASSQDSISSHLKF